MDSGEKRLNELGYKQELRREMTLFKTFAISFSTMTLFTGIIPLYGSSLLHAGPASLVWGWVVVSFFTWFVGLAMAEICSSFPTTGSLYFWAAHLAGPKWGPFASWCCAWLETIGLIAGMGTQAYAGSQTLQSIILLCTGTHKDGGYFAPKWLFLCMYIGLTIIWAVLNTFALEVIAFIDIISMWWQVAGGLVIIIMLPLVALTTQSASYVFTHFEMSPEATGISSKPYAVILSFLVSQYSLYGYDSAAHLTEETKGADKAGPIAILSSIGIISIFGWALILALSFSIQDFSYLYDTSNETAGASVPAQILYDAFHGRYHNSTGAIILLFVIWGSFFFGGLSVTTSAARVVYALSRDKGIPFSSIWRQLHPKHKVPSNAVWLCAAICIILGLPILKVNAVFTAITSICTIGWVGGYAVPIFARLVMAEQKFNAGPFYLGKASRPICLIAFLWICYTCSVFLLPTFYPISWGTFNYAPVALGVGLGLIMLWWLLDARKWFTGPVRNIDNEAFVEFNGGQQGLLHVSELSHEPVSRVSDVVSVGQQLSLRCIGQDVRGNIKLSLKAVSPRPEADVKGVVEGSVPVNKQATDVRASVGDVSNGQNPELPMRKNETPGVNSSTSSTPAVLIRSAAECDEEEKASGFSQSSKSTLKSTLASKSNSKPKKITSQSDFFSSTNIQKSTSFSQREREKLAECLFGTEDEDEDNKGTRAEAIVSAKNLKLGTKVAAKVYQVRARGLVLDLGGGIRGMYRFENNEKKDFVVGDELLVKCSSFTGKGIPVVSLVDS